MTTYTTISEIKASNKAIGHYFFSPDTMRFFNSKVESEVINGFYFITSEIDPGNKKMYSVRVCMNGKVETLGRFHSFPTEADARAFINILPDQLPAALMLAVDSYNNNEYNEFLKHALTEPANSKENKFHMDSFCGACTWIVFNWELLDMSFLKYYTELYETEMAAE